MAAPSLSIGRGAEIRAGGPAPATRRPPRGDPAMTPRAADGFPAPIIRLTLYHDRRRFVRSG